MVEALAHAIEARDPSTRGHAARVTVLAEEVAVRLGWGRERLATLRLGALLHDVGKLAVSSRVLRKPGPLTDAELRLIRIHPLAGARLIGRSPVARPAVPYVLYHHERWDGEGYPTGLAGRGIPLEARVLAIADAFDAMTSTRPYRLAVRPEEALAEVDRCAGTQFDPEVAELFLEVWDPGRLPLRRR
jgi:HD-GYP domain-containing protein (c-di-GMP phosphodiesterase class II)